jgi:cyclopropane fatty-acyl-phospholipid synthase-like methyltransferase
MNGEYYHTKESVEEYIKLSKGIDGSELIEKMKAFLESDANLLELGSGPGSDWELLNNYFNVTGSDNSSEFLQHLKAHNPQGKFLSLDATTLQTSAKYSGIYSNKVLHHLTDESLTSSVTRQSEVLIEGGIICHSFWKGEGSEIFKGLFVNYHTDQTLRDFFSDFFDILLLDHYAEFEEGDSILIIAKKKP